MNVKGTAFVTRKDTIVKAFGEERWNAFIAKLAAKDKYFSQTIMNITLIPLDKFVIFLDDVLKEFFNNDNNHYWKLGEKSADFSLAEGGPYHSFLLTKDIKQFTETVMPRIWSTYFDGGTFTPKFENNVIHITISNLPTKHIYFEYLIMGYIRQALVIFGKKATEQRVRGFSTQRAITTFITNLMYHNIVSNGAAVSKKRLFTACLLQRLTTPLNHNILNS